MPNELKQFNSETLTEIFRNLSIKEALAIRVVCKRWLKIINQIRFNKLALVQNWLPLDEPWSESIRQNSLLVVNKTKIEHQLKTVFWKENLKELYVFAQRPISVDCLNELQLLERLHLKFVKLDEKRTLELCALKELKIKQVSGNLVLNCPALEKLCCQSYAKCEVELRYSERIRFLECADFTFEIEKCTNLEYLYVYALDDLANPSFYLTKLTKLTQIHFLYNNYALVNLFCQRIVHKRHNLDIYFQGIKIDDHCEFRFMNNSLLPDTLDSNNLDFYLNHYSNMAGTLPFVRRFYYSEFDAKVAFGLVPKDFLRRFNNIQCVYATRRVYRPERFLEFLANCGSSLSTLRLCNTSLTTSNFYSCLAAVCPNLTHLELVDEEDVLGHVDFIFLFDLKRLMEFTTNKVVAFDLVCFLLKRLHFLQMLCFMNDESDAKIFKFRNCFELIHNDKFTYFKTLKELFLYFEQEPFERCS